MAGKADFSSLGKLHGGFPSRNYYSVELELMISFRGVEEVDGLSMNVIVAI